MARTAALPQPLTFAGFPAASWAYAIRIWLAVVLALYWAFWLELEAPSSAAITVAILALPTRGQALDKAVSRILATVLGVIASFVIVSVFVQSGAVMLWVLAAWIGLCVFVVGMLDGNRAYAASLGVTTITVVAIEQIDVPQNVFAAGVARGSAIVVGVLAITFINDLLWSPDQHPKMRGRLKSILDRIEEQWRNVLVGQPMSSTAAAGLLHDVTSLRPDIASLVSESSNGRARAASARSAMVELVSAVALVRSLGNLPPRGSGDQLTAVARGQLLVEFAARNASVGADLQALQGGKFPTRSWRAPLYRSRRLALESGAQAAIYFLLAAMLFGMSAWPSVTAALAFVGLLLALGATAPDQRAFAKLAVIVSPLGCVLAGILQFVVLNGATGFPILAIALAPFLIVCALLMTLKSPVLSSIGRLNMVVIIALVAPTNPQTYNPESFLFSCVFVCVAAGVLFALQQILPPASPQRQVKQLLAEARRDLARPLSSWRPDLSAEEALFRDALRVGQVAAHAATDPAAVDEAMRAFDTAASLRRCSDELARGDAVVFPDLLEPARRALALRDRQLLLQVAESIRARAIAHDVPVPSACGALVCAATTREPGT